MAEALKAAQPWSLFGRDNHDAHFAAIRALNRASIDPRSVRARPYIDRRAEVREEVGWPASALSDPETLYILARDTAQLVYTGSQPRIAFVTRDHPALQDPDPHSLVLLGWYKGARCVLVELG